MRGRRVIVLCSFTLCGLVASAPMARVDEVAPVTPGSQAVNATPFALFESGQVRPLALSDDGELLYAVNTPDNRLEVFHVEGRRDRLRHLASITVGLEPVAVAVRNAGEVWVVNHLSDSVSVVHFDADRSAGWVTRTLDVGDEPRDIVFGGPGRRRAFITAAHRGQNAPFDPQLTTPGIGRADVWVFDADAPGGRPLTILTLFTDTPRALAVTRDGSRVYAAGFHTGNQTTSIGTSAVAAGGGPPAPATNVDGLPAPSAALIVKWNGQHWVDETGRAWDHLVRLFLPDKDVFVIDADADPPRQLDGPAGFFSGVGTVLFNMVVNPVNGRVYVSNQEAFNEVRFEGAGAFTGRPTVRGHTHESRITVLGPGSVEPRRLNKHIDYSRCCAPVPNDESERSLAFPQNMAVTADGRILYVAALGSSKVGVFKTAELEGDTFVPSTASHIEVSGGGPTGLVLSPDDQRLFVLTRFDNSISIVDTVTRREIGHVAMFNPEPAGVVRGRRFLYDARLSSSHGDSACASCHPFGDVDSLAWDLGDPDRAVIANPNPFEGDPVIPAIFHPMKGPMVTQSLRGLANHGPMHWRGDRTGGGSGPSAEPDDGAFDEVAAFKAFNEAFVSLVGRDREIPEEDMQAFAEFIQRVMYPPNPVRALDNRLSPAAEAGAEFFQGAPSLAGANLNCDGCHVENPAWNAGLVPIPGLFGGNGKTSFVFEPQHIKNVHLRNQYQKVGMFGMASQFGINPGNNDHQGDQVRGFGFFHDGSIDTVFRFLHLIPFNRIPAINPGGFPVSPEGDAMRRNMEAYMLEFDTNFAPIVGQQVTLGRTPSAAERARADLLEARADLGECDLVAKIHHGDREAGFLYVGRGRFAPDRSGLGPVTSPLLRRLAGFSPLTYTAVPPGSGLRIGLDRDADGVLDGDEH